MSLREGWSEIMNRTVAMVFVCLVLLSSSACRFGSRVEGGEPPSGGGSGGGGTGAQTEKWSGYYEAEARTLEFCVLHEKDPDPSCIEISPSENIPSMISSIITNPSGFLVLDESKSLGAIFSNTFDPQVDPYIPTTINFGNGALNVDAYTDPSTVFVDPACVYGRFVKGDGNLAQGGSGTINGIKTRGVLNLDLSVVTLTEGDCKPTLELMAACYQNENDCGGSSIDDNLRLQRRVQLYFGEYINSGALDPADIPGVQGMAYGVSYR